MCVHIYIHIYVCINNRSSPTRNIKLNRWFCVKNQKLVSCIRSISITGRQMEGAEAGKVTSIISIHGLVVQPYLPLTKIVFYSTVYYQNSLLQMSTEAKTGLAHIQNSSC